MALVISGRNRDFINAFDESLRRLNEINAAIAKNTANKSKFTGDVLLKLQALHERIKEIVGKIARIKKKIVELQGLVIQNNSGVQAKEDELNNLKQQLAALTSERDNLTTQLDQVRNDSVAREAALQQQINDSEAQLRALTNTNAELTNTKNTIEAELNALRADVANRGDAQTQAHQAELQQLAEQHRVAIEQLNGQIADNQRQIADNERQIQELTNQHGAKDAQTQDLVNRNTELENRNRDLETQANALQDQLNTSQTELQTLQQNYANLDADSKARIDQALQDYRRLEQQIEENNRQITTLQTAIEAKDQEILRLNTDANNLSNLVRDKDGQIANLNVQIVEITRQIDELRTFSDELERKIKEATDVITDIANNLAELTNQQFYDDSNTQVDQAIADIDRTLGIINSEIDNSLNQAPPPSTGRSSGGVVVGRQGLGLPSSQRESKFSPRTINIHGYNYPELLAELKRISSQQSDKRNNKFFKAANSIDYERTVLDTNIATNDSVKAIIEKVLGNNGIVFDERTRAFKGGYKKTNRKRKHHGKFTRKQKGGFVYGKLKNTSNKSKNTSKTTSTTASLTSSSSYNTSKKNKKQKSKDFSKRKRM
jgi:chromosome segregation ATPase